MSIIDPFAPLEGGRAHRIDIRVAEGFTGVRDRSISRHLVDPLVRAGWTPSDAIALLHWAIVGVVVVVVVMFVMTGAAVVAARRR